jgi:hypothetical protein
MKDALAYTELAMSLHPRMGEAFFQAAKVRMALGQIDSAPPVLGKANDLDRFYALKAAGDGDFQKHDDRLRDFLEALRKEKYRQSAPIVKAALKKMAVLRQYAPAAKTNPAISRMEAFIATGGNWPLMDMLAVVQDLDAIIAEMKVLPIVVPIKGTCQVDVAKLGGFFRKASIVKETKNIELSMAFCYIPPGTFIMGEGHEANQVTLTKECNALEFFLGNQHKSGFAVVINCLVISMCFHPVF